MKARKKCTSKKVQVELMKTIRLVVIYIIILTVVFGLIVLELFHRELGY